MLKTAGQMGIGVLKHRRTAPTRGGWRCVGAPPRMGTVRPLKSAHVLRPTPLLLISPAPIPRGTPKARSRLARGAVRAF